MPLDLQRTVQRQKSSDGFTLLELLVVIAMMAILTGLLLPALSSAKERSRRCVCKANINQVLLALSNYGDENENNLPSGADNQGNFNSMRLSDYTFTNLLSYLGGVSNNLYCPNLAFATGKMGGHDSSGYTIGYSYLLEAKPATSLKGPDEWWEPKKANSLTNEIFADANCWSSDPSQKFTFAPHGNNGGVLASASISREAAKAGTNSAAIGAVGGNIGMLSSYSVVWRPIHAMTVYSGSDDGYAQGNW